MSDPTVFLQRPNGFNQAAFHQLGKQAHFREYHCGSSIVKYVTFLITYSTGP
jgi:hypothetical protein